MSSLARELTFNIYLTETMSEVVFQYVVFTHCQPVSRIIDTKDNSQLILICTRGLSVKDGTCLCVR